MALWSLRTKLVAVTAAALVPMVAVAGWATYDDILSNRAQLAERASSAVEQGVARHRELLEGSRRMVVAACAAGLVQKPLEPSATTGDINACEAYLAGVLQRFPSEYSSALITDESGIARCSTAPNEVGMSFADRQIFRLVREREGVSVGAPTSSRNSMQAAIPLGMPLKIDGRFRGMCALAVSLQVFSDLTAPTKDGAGRILLVDQAGAPVGGSAEMTFAMPVTPRLSAAISAGETRFSDYGQDGAFYQFLVMPLAGRSLFAIAAVPLGQGVPSIFMEIGRFALIGLGAMLVLAVTWWGADRWCVRPLRYIGEFAGRVARGEDVKFDPPHRWTQELVAVGGGVEKMAATIASREGDLKAGLEQRDHMLREIHHRVKNNLQMISSLLNLQAGEIRSPRIRRFFGDAQNRVLTLSILHRHLYERSSWSLVDFQQFISDLVRQISVPRPGIPRPAVRYQIRAPTMAVGPDTAIPVGLIVTEAVGSALSHDFTHTGAPAIRIEAIDKGGQEVELVIEDNGIDTNQGSIALNSRGSFGLTLIRGLATQLGGEARVSEREGGGVRIVVTFPMAIEEDGDA
jgi:two-component sensor histidine kinase